MVNFHDRIQTVMINYQILLQYGFILLRNCSQVYVLVIIDLVLYRVGFAVLFLGPRLILYMFVVGEGGGGGLR